MANFAGTCTSDNKGLLLLLLLLNAIEQRHKFDKQCFSGFSAQSKINFQARYRNVTIKCEITALSSLYKLNSL